VRVNHKALPLFDSAGKPFKLVEELRSMTAIFVPLFFGLLRSSIPPGRLGSTEAEVELVIVQPRDGGVEVFLTEPVGQTFVLPA
jgi:hypothetical protein